MLHILLWILKIIGIIFLLIIGAVLLILLILLFVPVRYRGDFQASGKLTGTLFVSWLFYFFTIRADFKDETEVQCKILWHRLFQKAENAEDETSEPDIAEPKRASIAEPPKSKESKESEDKAFEAEVRKETPKAYKPDREPDVQALESSRRKVKRKKQGIIERFRLFLEKQIEKVKRLLRWFQNKQEAYQKLRAFLEDEGNQEAFRLLFRKFKKILRHILPRRLQGFLRFGFDDPYMTGKVLTYISPFYSIYGDKIAVEPVFDRNVFEGNLHVKGKIRLAVLLWSVLCLFLNKNFRKLYHAIRGKNA